MTLRHALLVAALPLALGGCLRFGPKPPPTLFALTPDAVAPAGSAASGAADSAIVVEEPTTDKRLAVQRIPVQVDPANVAYLEKALWVERPSRLFASLLAETLRAKGRGRLVFAASEAESPGATRIGGRLLDMGYDAPTLSVVVRFDALKSVKGSVSTRRFESIVPVAEPKPELIGPALNRAANDVAGQVADWAV